MDPETKTCSWCGVEFARPPGTKGYAWRVRVRCSRTCRGSFEWRLWSKVTVRGPDECWPWAGRVRPDGYGTIRSDGRESMAHRAAYESRIGPIPDGHDVHHTCENRRCCNPAHLYSLPHGEHTRLHESAGRFHRAKTHCPQGHPYDAANTLRHGGRRYCRACNARRRQGHRVGRPRKP